MTTPLHHISPQLINLDNMALTTDFFFLDLMFNLIQTRLQIEFIFHQVD